MATEIAFAKQFLAQLDTKPSKIGPDHVEDARNYPGGNPFLIPKYASSPPLPKRRSGYSRSQSATATSTGSQPAASQAATETAVAVLASSARNPPLSLKFGDLPPSTTSLLDVKQLIHEETGIPLPKIKLLFSKKPVPDTKVLKDLGSGDVELGVMVLGGVGSVPEGWKKKPEPPKEVKQEESGEKMEVGEEEEEEEKPVVVAPGEISGQEVLKTEEFWRDLQGFLEQRVKDVDVASGLVGRWRAAEGSS
ncbi:cell-cycle control medial ring component [Cladorrhinum sp. PSN332]|nr:cell-cycle control medial ring component [Cladorrhinum sp. PSN332]